VDGKKGFDVRQAGLLKGTTVKGSQSADILRNLSDGLSSADLGWAAGVEKESLRPSTKMGRQGSNPAVCSGEISGLRGTGPNKLRKLYDLSTYCDKFVFVIQGAFCVVVHFLNVS